MPKGFDKLWLSSAALLAPGAALGWMVGMSVSPVTQTIVSAVATLLLGAVSVLVGIRSGKEGENSTFLAALAEQIRIAPISGVVLGLALGSAFGVYTRTHDWLGASDASSVSQTSDAHREGVLFSVPAAQCASLKLAEARNDLRHALLGIPDEHVQEFARRVADPEVLGVAVKELICPANNE